MEKRLPLALFLSFLVLFGWMMIFPPEEPPEEPAGRASDTPVDTLLADPEPVPELPLEPGLGAAAEENLVLEIGEPSYGEDIVPGAYRAEFSNRGGRLASLRFGDFFTRVGLSDDEKRDWRNWLPLLESIETPTGTTGSGLLAPSVSSEALAPQGLTEVLWVMNQVDARTVEFTYGPPGTDVVFRKRFAFEPDTWLLRLTLEIENSGQSPGGRQTFVWIPAGCVPPELGDQFYAEPRAVAAGGSFEDPDFDWKGAPNADGTDSIDVDTPLLYVGVQNKYFAFLMREVGERTRESLTGARYREIQEIGNEERRHLITVEVPTSLDVPAPGQKSRYEYLIYAGPKDTEVLTGDYGAYQVMLDKDLSTFSGIGKLLLAILGFFQRLTGNWGVAIILLTICVRLVLFPLNRRSQTTMARYQKKMKRVQPKLEEIKQRHANDPQKLREAQARIMQEEGAFPPLGGCLPIFLQLPIFFGLFSALRTSFDLRQEPFYGWINDLSRPDRLLELNIELPILPDIEYLNLLPILMVVLWILQQRGMPQPADDQAARMQKIMTFMPIVFGFMLYNYAAGLSLYMMTQSTLGIFEQKVIKKLWPIDDAELETKKRSGCGPFSGMMENLAVKQKEQMKRLQAQQEVQKRQKRKKKRR